MFSNKSVNSKVLAVAFVSMLMICSLGMMLSEESDAVTHDPETYTINMSVNDIFSYTPAVNLNDTDIEATGTAVDPTGTDGLVWTETALSQGSNGYSMGTVEGHFSTAGQRVLTITATWHSTTDETLEQISSQVITFNVYDDITFPGIDHTGDASQAFTYQWTSLTAGTEIDNLGSILNQTGYNPSITFTVAPVTWDGEGAAPDIFEFNTSTGVLSVSNNATTEDCGTYTIVVTATDSHVTGQSATMTYTIKVNNQFGIEAVESFETFVTDEDPVNNTVTLDTNWGTTGITFSITSITSAVEGGSATEVPAISTIASITGNTLTLNTAEAGLGTLLTDEQEYTDLVITVNATGEIGDPATQVDDDVTINVRVFNSLLFMNDPEMVEISMQSATGNPLDALATANFEGTSRIVYNWGDGTSTTVNVTPDSGSKFSARHVYNYAGTYAVTITAFNEQSESRAIILYDATNGAWAEGTEEDVPEEEQSFFEEHGILFIILAILGIVMILLFFFGFLAPYTLIAGFILVIAAVACFITGDFGLTEGLIEDLNI